MGVESLEDTEEFVGIAHVKARAVVPHEIDLLSCLAGLHSDLDLGSLALAGELHRIPDQIDPDLPDHRLRAEGRRDGLQVELNHVPRLHCRQLLEDLPGHRFHIDPPRFDLLSSQSREGQEIVDEPSHPLRLAADHADQASSLDVELGGIVLLDDAGKTIDGPQRCPQIVRDRVGKGIEFLHRGLQLRSPVLQAGVEFTDFLQPFEGFSHVEVDSDHMRRLPSLSANGGIRSFDDSDGVVRVADDPELPLVAAGLHNGVAQRGFLLCHIVRMNVARPILVTDQTVIARRHSVD